MDIRPKYYAALGAIAAAAAGVGAVAGLELLSAPLLSGLASSVSLLSSLARKKDQTEGITDDEIGQAISILRRLKKLAPGERTLLLQLLAKVNASEDTDK